MNTETLVKILNFSLAFSTFFCGKIQAEPLQQPNVVIILLDDSGYGDFHPFGDPPYETPNVEQLAAEGMRLNNFYIPQAVCSASRSALLSGSLPGRTKVFGALGPKDEGLDPKFMTMAEMFRKNGYTTAHFGKWHCGDTPETRPMARGFDEHAGLMYSNDMWKHHPKNPEHWGKHPLEYWENGRVKITDVSNKDQTQLTTWSTEYAVDFIHRSSEKPFFLYLAHSMPHVPIFCSDKFLGKSGVGLYGDVIMELDWSVGEVMAAINDAGVGRKTIVIFTSDNGPWSDYGDHAGITPFRAYKTTSFDGGIRMATIMKYPEKIQAGSEMHRITSSIDLLPTLAHLTHTPLPDNEIDGKNIWSIISEEQGTDLAHDYYPISTGRKLEAIISGDGQWKLHLPHNYRHILKAGKDGKPGQTSRRAIELSLFNLGDDPTESNNLIDQYPEIATKLKAYVDQHKQRFYE
ncbi:MAG: sulfatase [Verrucomicrobiota bacterium]